MQYLTRKMPLAPDPKTASTLWYISRRCNQIWNLMVEERQAAFREGKVDKSSRIEGDKLHLAFGKRPKD